MDSIMINCQLTATSALSIGKTKCGYFQFPVSEAIANRADLRDSVSKFISCISNKHLSVGSNDESGIIAALELDAAYIRQLAADHKEEIRLEGLKIDAALSAAISGNWDQWISGSWSGADPRVIELRKIKAKNIEAKEQANAAECTKRIADMETSGYPADLKGLAACQERDALETAIGHFDKNEHLKFLLDRSPDHVDQFHENLLRDGDLLEIVAAAVEKDLGLDPAKRIRKSLRKFCFEIKPSINNYHALKAINELAYNSDLTFDLAYCEQTESDAPCISAKVEIGTEKYDLFWLIGCADSKEAV